MDSGIDRMGLLDATLAMERPHGSFAAPWDQEPRTSQVVPATRCCRRLVGRASLRFLCRQDAGSTLRFMESPHAIFAVHWDHEPTPQPLQGGERISWPVPLLG